MANPATGKRRGNQFETDLMRWLRDAGYVAERLPLTGAKDEGDLYFLDPVRGVYVLFECKAPGRDGRINLTGWLKEARVEADNFTAARGLDRNKVHEYVIVKARGKPLAEAFIISTLTDMLAR